MSGSCQPAFIFPLNDCDDEDDHMSNNCCNGIEIFIPGPQGPPLVSTGSFLVPISIDGGSIVAPVQRWQRMFIQAVHATVTNPTIANPADNGAWLLGLQVVGGYPVILNDASNIKLSGEWVANPDSILWLLWDGNSRWVESGRNEI